jgi:hypothetical protein
MKTVLSVLFFYLALANNCRAQVPSLNSLPSASATVYLDFDGQYVSGTSWNWMGDIDAQPATLSIAAITEIFNRVAEDFRIFDMNITTDSIAFLAAPPSQRMRIIITPSSEWYGSAGGISFIESFTWGDDTPAFVFSNLLGNNIKYIAEACSHETGHTLGLQHQSTYDAYCRKTAEYWSGQGSGEIGWAPIMGVGYYRNLTTWYKGKSSLGCTYIQDDISRILSTNGFGLRTDDYGDVTDLASNIQFDGSSFEAAGIINSAQDADVFRFELPVKQNFRLIVYPEHVGISNSGADADIRISLLNAMADTINRYNPAELLNAGVDTTLTPGTYYLVVEGVGNSNLSDYGSLGHYILSGALNMPLPVHYLKVKGKVLNNYHLLNWTYQTDEAIKEFEVQFSFNGSSFQKLLAVGSSMASISCEPSATAKVYYRVKAVTLAQEFSYYSNIISLPPGPKYHTVTLLNRLVKDGIKLNSGADCNYQLMLPNGQVIEAGKITKGFNNIAMPTNVKGVFLLRIIYANEVWTEKIVRQ